MLHQPILRWGRRYESVDQTIVPHFRTREPFVAMSQANVGLIRRDLLKQADARARLAEFSVRDLAGCAKAAAEYFLHDPLPLDEAHNLSQTPQQYVEQVTATTGMPWAN